MIKTTESNQLVRPLHNRMPVVIPNGLEEDWIAPVKNGPEMKALEPILIGWSPNEWMIEPSLKTDLSQTRLF